MIIIMITNNDEEWMMQTQLCQQNHKFSEMWRQIFLCICLSNMLCLFRVTVHSVGSVSCELCKFYVLIESFIRNNNNLILSRNITTQNTFIRIFQSVWFNQLHIIFPWISDFDTLKFERPLNWCQTENLSFAN